MKKEYSFGIIPLRFFANEWQVLLVQHIAGHWSFPKGHVDEGELPRQTAERELLEETGLEVEQYVADDMLQETYFFKYQDVLIKKEVGYFIAVVKGDIKLQEEEVKAVEWLSLLDSLNRLNFSESKKMIHKTMQLIEMFTKN